MHTCRPVLQDAADAGPLRPDATVSWTHRAASFTVRGMPVDARYEYRRYQALGNDYIVVGDEMTELLSEPARIRRLCDRHIGLGSDGILLPASPPPGFA